MPGQKPDLCCVFTFFRWFTFFLLVSSCKRFSPIGCSSFLKNHDSWLSSMQEKCAFLWDRMATKVNRIVFQSRLQTKIFFLRASMWTCAQWLNNKVVVLALLQWLLPCCLFVLIPRTHTLRSTNCQLSACVAYQSVRKTITKSKCVQQKLNNA